MNYRHDAGTDSPRTYTVPDGLRVRRYSLTAGGGGATVVITPKGGTAQPTITVLANGLFGDEFLTAPNEGDEELPGGSTITITGAVAHFMRYTK
jgi:hypothetical protein